MKKTSVSVGITCLVLKFRKSFNIIFQSKRRYMFFASRQVKILFHRGISRQGGRGFGAPAQVIEKTPIPFLRKYIVPAAKPVRVDLLKSPARKNVEVVSGKRT